MIEIQDLENIPIMQFRRKIIPILDEEAPVTYYLVCKQEMKRQFTALFHQLPDWCKK